MSPYITLASYSLAAALGAGGAWKWQGATITELELSHANERIASQRAERARAEQRVATVRAAELQAQGRMERLATDLERNRTELERLQDATDAAMRAASTSLEACTAHAAAQGELLNSCAGRLVDVAAKADGHVSDIQTLMESE